MRVDAVGAGTLVPLLVGQALVQRRERVVPERPVRAGAQPAQRVAQRVVAALPEAVVAERAEVLQHAIVRVRVQVAEAAAAGVAAAAPGRGCTGAVRVARVRGAVEDVLRQLEHEPPINGAAEAVQRRWGGGAAAAAA